MKSQVLPVLFLTLLIDMIGFGMVIPILPILFTDPTSSSFLLKGYSEGAQFFFAGFVLALFGVVQFFTAPIMGQLSDVYGRKNILLAGVVTLAASQMLFSFGITIGSLVVIVLARAIGGIAGANFSVAQAIIADVTPPEERTKSFGLIGAAFGLGFIAGPVIGGWFAHAVGTPAAPFVLAGMLGLLNSIGVMFALPETHKGERSMQKRFSLGRGISNIKTALGDVQLRPLFITNFFLQLGFSCFTAFIGILLLTNFGYSSAQIGTYFGAVGLWMIITQAGILRLVTDTFSPKTILMTALPILSVSMLAYAIADHPVWLYMVMPFTAISIGLASASILGLLSKHVSNDKQGVTLGINSSVQALAIGTGPLLAGVVASGFGLFGAFLLAALAILGARVVFGEHAKKL